MFKKYSLASRGFTLVELLVVIAIISALATLLLLQLGVARGKARDLRRITDVNQLRSMVEMYFDDNAGKYPTALTKTNLGTYLGGNAMPNDPILGSANVDPEIAEGYKYAFNPITAPNRFQVWVQLENFNQNALSGDADIDTSAWAGGDKINGALDAVANCGGAYPRSPVTCVYDVGQK